MILNNNKSSVLEVVGDNTAKTASINTNKLSKLQYLLTKGLYSDAQSAVIQELACNAIDAIIESGKDPIENPVKVVLHSPNYGKYNLSIEDKGIGMNKDFFENFFMALLSSTKENSNEYIGAMG